MQLFVHYAFCHYVCLIMSDIEDNIFPHSTFRHVIKTSKQEIFVRTLHLCFVYTHSVLFIGEKAKMSIENRV